MMNREFKRPKQQKLISLSVLLLLQTTLWVLSLAFFPVYAADCGQAGAPACISDILVVFQNIISFLAPAAAIAFLVVLLFGGFKFLTSGGDQKQVSSARSTMTYAIIGIILVVTSWLVLELIASVTGIDVTKVSLP